MTKKNVIPRCKTSSICLRENLVIESGFNLFCAAKWRQWEQLTCVSYNNLGNLVVQTSLIPNSKKDLMMKQVEIGGGYHTNLQVTAPDFQ
jgi:hypothetical protein